MLKALLVFFRCDRVSSTKITLSKAELSFVRQMNEDVNDWFVSTRNIPMSAEEYKKLLPVVARHLSKKYTGLGLYNAWYVWHTAHDLGLLKDGMPIEDAIPVNAESLRIAELFKAGGEKAVSTYLSNF